MKTIEEIRGAILEGINKPIETPEQLDKIVTKIVADCMKDINIDIGNFKVSHVDKKTRKMEITFDVPLWVTNYGAYVEDD